MQVKMISCSQNKKRGHKSNSAKIGETLKQFMSMNEKVEEVDIIHLSDYDMSSCTLCGKCGKTHRCVNDPNFNRLFVDLKQTDMFLVVVPYYSPIPSSVSIVLEKLNQILVASHLEKNPLSETWKEKKVGLIVHGGMVTSEAVKNHYEVMIAKPLAHTLKNLGFNFLSNDAFPYGYTLGLESDQAVSEKENELFPRIDHSDEYLNETLKEYGVFLQKNV